MNFPDIEVVAASVHASWMESKIAAGFSSRLAEDGEELMVPYSQLSEAAKDLDRGTVRAVYEAMRPVYEAILAAEGKSITANRDAGTGKFVTSEYAKGHAATTVKEKIARGR